MALADVGKNLAGCDIVNDLIRRSSAFCLKYQPHMPDEVYAEHKATYHSVVAGAPDINRDRLTKRLTVSIGRVRDAHAGS